MILDRDQVTVLLCDIQLDILPLLVDGAGLLHGCRWVADVSKEFGLPVLLTKHKKLGEFPPSLGKRADEMPVFEKDYFDLLSDSHAADHVLNDSRNQYVLAGAETHVVLLQTALSLLSHGKEVFVLGDTCQARNAVDHTAGLKRLQSCGVQILTREMFFFEIIRRSEDPKYIKLARAYLDGRYLE
ncbi:isochorismatase family protein [uncultured Corynebacterium sp.]|uniref:isochorismatase family protein n=1 Tax=uncultured Corynebacterium sp. TaxID=159447 RepID=UPI0025F3ACE9|nr:isochorismatase family protein [uncultured Corynebacterium sp.]